MLFKSMTRQEARELYDKLRTTICKTRQDVSFIISCQKDLEFFTNNFTQDYKGG